MVITYFNELALFLQSINPPEDGTPSAKTFTVTYNDPHGQVVATIDIPLVPELTDPEIVEVTLHQSATKAFKMGEPYNSWFSSCLGYKVLLVYLGPNLRQVLGNLSPYHINPNPLTASSWMSSITNYLFSFGKSKPQKEEGITFADIAPYMVITEESFHDVATRLSAGSMMDITKFRPNIVISGAEAAYDEDFWAEILITNMKDTEQKECVELVLTQNCARCVSINIDYSTGKQGTDEAGKVLKKLMSYRRVDKGTKYSPVFGRYGFLRAPVSPMKRIAIGDKVDISSRNEERTTFGRSNYDCWEVAADPVQIGLVLQINDEKSTKISVSLNFRALASITNTQV